MRRIPLYQQTNPITVTTTEPATGGPSPLRPSGPDLDRADGAGIALRPLRDCGAAGSEEGTVPLVLGYAHLAPGDIARGVAALADAWRSGRAGPG